MHMHNMHKIKKKLKNFIILPQDEVSLDSFVHTSILFTKNRNLSVKPKTTSCK